MPEPCEHSVCIQLLSAKREQLHDVWQPGVMLVRRAPDAGQILSHDRTLGHLPYVTEEKTLRVKPQLAARRATLHLVKKVELHHRLQLFTSSNLGKAIILVLVRMRQ